MKPIGLIFNGVWSHYVFATAPKYRDLYELVYVHDLTDTAIAGFRGLAIPFQSNQQALTARQDVLYRFLAAGKKIFVEGDTTADWLDAQWEDRPVDNYWWVANPDKPPVSHTDYAHPLFHGLTPRQACWHLHGIYTRIPAGARVLQTNAAGEVATWEPTEYGGALVCTTLDPIVEHGVQQIRHLDNFCDRMTAWLSGVTPARESLTIDPALYGVGALVS